MMIMGEICTRACAFCNVRTGLPTAARSERARKRRRSPSKSSASTHVVITSVDRDDLPDGGAEHFAQVIRAIRAPDAEDHDRDPDARLPAQGGRARGRRRGQARRLQPQPRNGAVQVPQGPSRRALLPLDPPAAAGQGTRSHHVHQVRHHGRARRGAERSAAADGRPALGRCRFPDHRAVPGADQEAPCRWPAS